MTNSVSNWIHLRQLVILLGEHKGWWPTQIMTGRGVEYLSYVLPKTQRKAAFQLSTEICKAEHDKQIGPGRYHLFRLPQKWEEQIFNELGAIVETFKILSDSEALKDLLILSEAICASAATGPVLIGAHSELNDKSIFQSLGRYYYEAFNNNFKTYPYLN